MITLVVVGVVLLLLLSLVVMYNRFVRQRTLIDESWGQTDVELTRRHELIPNLRQHRAGLRRARARRAGEPGRAPARPRPPTRQEAPKQREQFQESLGIAVATVMVRAEAYPQLKANSNFLALQGELSNTEDRIAAARRFFNGNVRAYINRVRPSRPTSSPAFGFHARDFFSSRIPPPAPRRRSRASAAGAGEQRSATCDPTAT